MGEKGCLGRTGVLVVKRGIGYIGVFGGVKGCRRYNGVVWGANEVLAMG